LQTWRREIYWLLLALNSLVPGIWIGEIAKDALPIAVAYLMSFLILRWAGQRLNRAVDPQPDGIPAFRLDPAGLLFNSVLLLLGTLVGVTIHRIVRF
jgi:hypothetical protein